MSYTKTITLKNGIVVEDSRSIQCGVFVKNQKTNFAQLHHKQDEFVCLVRSRYYNLEELQVLQKEIQEINECITELKQIS